MPSPALLLIIAVLLPLLGFLVLLSIGKRLEAPLAGWVGTSFIVGSFACTLMAMVKWYEGIRGHDSWGLGDRPILRTIPWIPAGNGMQQNHPGFLDLGVYVDSLTIAIFATVTLVAAIIHIFSIGFMRHEAHFSRLFAFLGLACFAMLGLVIGGTLLQLLIFWQLVGLASALLVGISLSQPRPLNAAIRTFVFHLVGDCGFLIGFGILYCKLGNATLPFLWMTLGDAASGHAVVLPGGGTFSTTLLTLTGICLFFGAIAKSAQFPLHTWIADAGAAPIPAGAMICTATTTLAGVYFLGRLFPILTPDARLFIAIIGLVTLTMAALIALAQDELPRMLVWTAVSQFGFMILAMGVGSWVGGLFHMMTAAFTLALLFLAAGSVAAAANREQRISQLGGLWRKLPVTAAAFAVGVLAITGAHMLSRYLGQYHGQSIIAADTAAFASYATHFGGRAWGYWIFFALPAGVVFLTGFYLTRCWFLVFLGEPRGAEFDKQARDLPALWGPLLALLVPTVIAGYAMNIPQLLRWCMVETQTLYTDLPPSTSPAQPTRFTAFQQAWPAIRATTADPEIAEPADGAIAAASPAAKAHESGAALAQVWVWAWLAGIALGAGVYRNGSSRLDRLVRRPPLAWAHHWLCNGMYFDELYYWTFVRLLVGLAVVCHALDRFVLGAAVDGIARLVLRLRYRMASKK